ncbi:lysozyme-like domain-containing protein, partial [Geopyxis carbonaria]
KVEGLVLTPYPDQRGDTTIGIGHNCVVHGACPDPLADEAAAYALMYSDLVQFETAVCSWDGAKNMNQNQFNAMVSYAFQRGEFGAKDDWSAQIAAGDWAGISQALPTTNPMDRRRDEEKILFDSPSDMNCGC